MILYVCTKNERTKIIEIKNERMNKLWQREIQILLIKEKEQY